MKALFNKNLIHPTYYKNENSEDNNNNKGGIDAGELSEVPIVIPIRNELRSFERRLNNNEIYSPGETGWSGLILRRHYRNQDVPYHHNETCKYEVFNPLAGAAPIYHISEKTEFFVKDTGCFFQPRCREFIMTPTTPNCLDSSNIKLIVEFGRTGFCNGITVLYQKRRMGTISRKCSVIPNSYKYSVRNSHNCEIASVNSKYCFKSNLLCLRECQQFNIFMRKERLPRGKIIRESLGFAMVLFHGDDAVAKILLVVALVLMDLQTLSLRRRKGFCQCDFVSCCFQLVASIFFYMLVLALILFLFFVFFSR
ncbi:uncharacterized protein LOC118436494 [Folsomia candida]|uniref:Uncharacterized protein n=1 Tax=Folsomia candida TaxID=158441 RepID=A0A226E121_FOLCA|nr:uncharacterized protein LOC118436494 [Folsomia candida]XP_035710586.1 uncharacterized protein LOC118436494 [Folsomia candida]XP_035710587.1 uncharacterized protein LOC118436494 [Folsomia candida]XP_035710588.1 uncharacterized protein LOC118436494 [Folsomia candida]XP_035710590.1 uncharacterized protein LOC118436494 [Folsomia candida]XP_035710591.1 uncharacterized protein LOC118436494 [Folsomia candida]OXA51159.1 hypothetical protein Fcan01_13921 [Folsomia candida]